MDNTAVIDGDTGEVISEVMPDKPHFEMIVYEGQDARFYPQSGAIMLPDEKVPSRWKIVANNGGRPDFDGPAMGRASVVKRQEAIMRGLVAADGHLKGLGDPTGMLAKIVENQAIIAATLQGRDSTNAAKFIFSVVAVDEEDKETGPAMKIEMTKEVAEAFIEAMVSE